jgi:hypothetical protein
LIGPVSTDGSTSWITAKLLAPKRSREIFTRSGLRVMSLGAVGKM